LVTLQVLIALKELCLETVSAQATFVLSLLEST